MSDWSPISIQEFDAMALVDDADVNTLTSRLILDRLPYAFDSKIQYLDWRDDLGESLELDGRDLTLVGSAATGRSLSARKQFGIFGKGSDIDLAVVSHAHFDRAWTWFRLTDPTLLMLDEEGIRQFEQHRKHHVYEGVIAANVFLSYLPFGAEWNKQLQRASKQLPSILQGRRLNVRVYKDYAALRWAQSQSLTAFRRYKAARPSIESGEGSDRKLP